MKIIFNFSAILLSLFLFNFFTKTVIYAADDYLIFHDPLESLSSIQAKGGVLSNLKIQNAYTGQGAFFNATSSSLSYQSAGKFNFLKGAIDFWIKPNWNGDSIDSSKFFFSSEADGNKLNIFLYKGANTNYFVFRADHKGANFGAEASTSHKEPGMVMTWRAGTWHHVQAYWDFSSINNKYLLLMLDDEIMSSTNYSPSFSSSLPTSFNIGSRQDLSNRADAVIDEFKIYDRYSPFTVFTGEGMRFNSAADGSIYLVKPIVSSAQLILPNSKPSTTIIFPPTPPTLKVRGVRGGFEPASFVISPSKNLSAVQVTATSLVGNNVTLPSSVVDLRVVKNWFQSGSGNITKGLTTLVPELLLKDDNLVLVDENKLSNSLKIKKDGLETYIDISNASSTFPKNIILEDAGTLQPFDVRANTNKQVWLTFNIPSNALAGIYKGSIILKMANNNFATIPLELTVLPFDLAPAPIEYSIYYTGRLRDTVNKLGESDKTSVQYRAELQNMKNHGILYPNIYQGFDSKLGEALQIRKEIGLPTDKLYVLGMTSNAITAAELVTLKNNIIKWKALISQYGYQDLYIYGQDEAAGDVLLAERPAWQLVHDNGAYNFVAVYTGAVDLVGDLLDYPILSGIYKPDEVAKWHAQGKKVANYGNPQVGVENPDIYRRNYGIPLYCAGYDGAMDFAYQYGSEYLGASIWNDFDIFGTSPHYRDHVFAYPTSSGVIDTIEWEGFREAVKDTQYLATLMAVQGVAVKDSICASYSATKDLDQLRADIIDILIESQNNKSLNTAPPLAPLGLKVY